MIIKLVVLDNIFRLPDIAILEKVMIIEKCFDKILKLVFTFLEIA